MAYKYKYKPGVRITLTKNRIILFAIVCVAVAVIALISNHYLFQKPEAKSWDYHGTPVAFRANPRDAEQILVYPDDASIHNILWNPERRNITIVYKELETGSGYYVLEAYEITNKLSIAYLHREITPISGDVTEIPKGYILFSAQPVEDYEGITAGPYDIMRDLVIALNPTSDETAVRVSSNIIFLNAKSVKELDVVTVKFLTTALEIEV